MLLFYGNSLSAPADIFLPRGKKNDGKPTTQHIREVLEIVCLCVIILPVTTISYKFLCYLLF